jgi:hypothetical protein
MSDRKLPHQEQDALMSTTFDGTNRDQLLAARRAALTKALKSYRATEDKDSGPIAAAKAANVINLAAHWDSLRMRLLGTDVPREVYRLLSKTMLRQKPKVAPLSRRRKWSRRWTTFSPERDLQRTPPADIGQIDSNLHIVDGGKEQTVASERIDMLARIKME